MSLVGDQVSALEGKIMDTVNVEKRMIDAQVFNLT